MKVGSGFNQRVINKQKGGINMWEDIIRKKAPTTNKEAQAMGYKNLKDYTNRKAGDVNIEWDNPEGLDVNDPKYSKQLEQKTGFHINPEGPTSDEGHKNIQPNPKWSKVFEGDLMTLLNNIAIESREELDSKGMISPGKQSVNKEKIMGIANKFVDDLYKEAQIKYDALMANPSLKIEDNIFAVIIESIKEFVEQTLHTILEEMYVSVKLTHDTETDITQNFHKIDPSGEIPKEIIDLVASDFMIDAHTDIQKDIDFIPEVIQGAIQESGINLDKVVVNEINTSIKKVISDNVEKHKENLDELGAYVFIAFYHNLPIKQMEMSPEDTKEGVEEEREMQEIPFDSSLTDEQLRDFKFQDDDEPDDKLARKALNSFTDKWMDILYKDTGAETTGSTSYKDGKLGNIQYNCGCENEGKKCRCNE